MYTLRILANAFTQVTQTSVKVETVIIKLKSQYVGHLMQRADSLEKTLMLGKTESKRRRE